MTEKNKNQLGYLGFLIITICANYLLGSMAIYGAAAFTEFDQVNLFGTLIIIESVARSLSLLISGRVGERVGRKKLFLFSVTIFGVMIILAALAPNAALFMWSRGIASFFWGLFQANIFTMIGETFSEKEYPIRVGWLQTIGSLILLLGPVLCGILIQVWNWRIALFAILPLFLISLLLVGLFQKEQPTASQSRTTSQGSTSTGLQKLFSQQGFVAMVLLTFLYTCISSSGTYIPLFAQSVLAASPTISSLILIPCNLLVMLFSNLTGIYIAKHGCDKRLVRIMALIGLTGSFLYTLLIPASSYPLLVLSSAVVGSGYGISQVLPVSFVQGYIAKPLIAEGTSFIVFIQGFSAVIAGIVYSVAMNQWSLPFALATTIVYGIIMVLIAVNLYKEPNPSTEQELEISLEMEEER